MKNSVKLIGLLLTLILVFSVTGCSSDTKTEESNTQSSIVKDSGVKKMEYKETDILKFVNTHNYSNFKIVTDKEDEYYNYEGYCVVLSSEDDTKRVIKDNIVYLVTEDQYWETDYDFDDNPYDIGSVVNFDSSITYYKVGDWYFCDYTNVDDNIVSVRKYKVADNSITVAVVEFMDHSKEPFNNKVIDEITYTVTELKSKDEVPEVDFDKLEEVSVSSLDEPVFDTDNPDENIEKWDELEEEESDEISVPDELEESDDWGMTEDLEDDTFDNSDIWAEDEYTEFEDGDWEETEEDVESNEHETEG